MISKESIFDYARRMYIFLGIRRLCTCPSDPLGVVALMRNHGRKVGLGCWADTTAGNDSRGKASKARLSDGRRRPPVARRDGRDKAETIMWRPVLIRARYHRRRGRKRPQFCVFSIYRIVDRRAFDRITMSKEYVYANSRQMYIFLVF